MQNWVFFVLFFFSMTSFISTFSHLLSTLIAMEFMALSLFFIIMFSSLNLPKEFSFTFLYLAIAVCEGALGLSLLIMFTRSAGNELLNIAHLLKW